MPTLSPRQQSIVDAIRSLPLERPPLIPLLSEQLGIETSIVANELVALYEAEAIRVGKRGFYI